MQSNSDPISDEVTLYVDDLDNNRPISCLVEEARVRTLSRKAVAVSDGTRTLHEFRMEAKSAGVMVEEILSKAPPPTAPLPMDTTWRLHLSNIF